MELTKGQQKAYDAIMSGENVFLTGEAGTGKSFVTEKVIKDLSDKKIIVCAPTGVAAVNVGGTTIHKMLKLHDGTYSIKNKKIRSKTIDVLKEADVVFIDEISMCRIDLFDCLYKCIKKSNPNIQLVVIGDFCQLPPVLPEAEQQILSVIYGKDIFSGFAFESENWSKCNFTNIQLDEIMRQKDNEFIENLNKARYGDSSCIPYFNNNAAKEPTNGVYLSGTNKEVAEKNEEELKKLKGKEYKFEAKKTGEDISKNVLADEKLLIKKGAKVMVLINDPEKDIVNGDIGKIIEIKENEIDIEVRGKRVTITRHTWSSYIYEIKETIKEIRDPKTGEVTDRKIEKTIKKEEAGTFKQFPIKLAYAVTIHKSQGQTYDAVDLNPYCWDSGQLYCALSRVRDIKKLWLKYPINPRYLKLDDKVKQFYAGFRPEKREYVMMRIPLELKEKLEEALAKYEEYRNAQIQR